MKNQPISVLIGAGLQGPCGTKQPEGRILRQVRGGEGGVRVPFIVRWPGRVPAGKVDETTPLAAVDFLLTLCAAAGVKPPADFRSDGENMLPALLGEPRPRTTPLFRD